MPARSWRKPSCPSSDDDTAETLAARILAEEHRIYTEAVRLVSRRPFSHRRPRASLHHSREKGNSSMARRQHFKPVENSSPTCAKAPPKSFRKRNCAPSSSTRAKTGKPLRVKLGVDPTAPDLHLGHTVVLRKLKHFQDHGPHGDFSDRRFHRHGRRSYRPIRNAAAADARAGGCQCENLSRSGLQNSRSRTHRSRYNSEWLGKLTSIEMIQLVRRNIGWRACWSARISARASTNNQPISVHELLYPLLQAYDSVDAGSRRRARRHRAEIQFAGRPRNPARIRTGVARWR